MQQILSNAVQVPEASYYSGWDKVGAVAVSMLILGGMGALLLFLIKVGVGWLTKISQAHMEFVQKQTAVMTQLQASNEQMTEASATMHERLDTLLGCTRSDCAVFKFRKQQAKEKVRFMTPGTQEEGGGQ